MVEKYISRNELLKLYVDGKYDTAEYHVPVPVIIQNIKDIPAADVRPVVRGEWKKVGTQMHLNLDNAREQYRELGYPHRNIECLQCSNCRKVSMVDESIQYEFCPHCGAKMEG